MANLIEIIINAVDSASPVITSLGGSVEGFGGKLKQLGTSITLLTAPIDAFLGTSLKAASDVDTRMAQLTQVIKSTGGAAGITADAATKMADALSKVTRYDDDAIVGGESLLLTFTNIGHDVFPQATQAILDVSTAMGQDLKSSAVQLGKALNDPTTGLTALTRIGVTFTQQQKDQIEAMQKSGDMAGAQTIILKELQREFGGSAEAAGKTFAGGLDILRNKMQNVQESIGHMLMPILQKLVDFISPIIDAVSDWMEKNPQLAQTIVLIAGALGVLGPALIAVGVAVSAAGTAIEGLGVIVDIALGPVGLLIAAAAALFIAFQTNFLGIRDLVQPILDTIGRGLGEFFQQIQFSIDSMNDAFGEHGIVGGLDRFFRVFEDGSSAISGILQAFGMIPANADAVAGAFENVYMRIRPALEGAQALVEWFVKGFTTNIQLVPFYADYYLGGLWDKIQPMLKPILDWFTGSGSNSFSGAVQAGWNFLNSTFIQPIVSVWTNVLFPALTPIIQWFVGTGQNSFLGAVQTAWNFINTVFIQPLSWFWTQVLEPQFRPIIDWFTGSGQNSFIGAVQTAWNFIHDTFIVPISQAWDTISTNANNFIAIMQGAWERIKPYIQPLLDFLNTVLDVIQKVIGGLASIAPTPYNPNTGSVTNLPTGPITPTIQLPTGGGSGSTITLPNGVVVEVKGAWTPLPAVTGTAAGTVGSGSIGIHDFPGTYQAGVPYLIGTGAQPQVFVPGESGYTLPNGGGRRSGFTWNGDINIPPNSSINVSRAEIYDWMDAWAEENGLYG